MKALICIFCLGSVASLLAQEAPTDLPEPTEPPFEVSALPLESGYTIERKGAPDLNYRFRYTPEMDEVATEESN